MTATLPLIAALTDPRRKQYIKSRKQRAERNATAVTFRAPPPRADLRAVLAAAGGAARGGRPGLRGRGRPAGPAVIALRDWSPAARAQAGRCAQSDPRRGEGVWATSRLREAPASAATS